MKDIKARILYNEKILAGYFKIALQAPEIARDAEPGQFVMMRCANDQKRRNAIL